MFEFMLVPVELHLQTLKHGQKNQRHETSRTRRVIHNILNKAADDILSTCGK